MAAPDFYLLYKDIDHHLVDPCINIQTLEEAEEHKEYFQKQIADGGIAELTLDRNKAIQFERSCPICRPKN